MRMTGSIARLREMSRSNQGFKREPVRSKDYVMPFGKYKGETIADLLFDDPAYLEWLHTNTDFELHADLLDEVQTSYEDAARNARLHAD